MATGTNDVWKCGCRNSLLCLSETEASNSEGCSCVRLHKPQLQFVCLWRYHGVTYVRWLSKSCNHILKFARGGDKDLWEHYRKYYQKQIFATLARTKFHDTKVHQLESPTSCVVTQTTPVRLCVCACVRARCLLRGNSVLDGPVRFFFPNLVSLHPLKFIIRIFPSSY
jgi:hypothetical protein